MERQLLNEINKAYLGCLPHQRTFELFSNEVRTAVSSLLGQLLQTEMSIFLGFPNQKKNNKRNGYYERDFGPCLQRWNSSCQIDANDNG